MVMPASLGTKLSAEPIADTPNSALDIIIVGSDVA